MSHYFNYQSLGIAAAALLIYAFFPLISPLFKAEKCQNIPTRRLFCLVIANILWVMYGISDSSPAVVLLGIGGLVITSLLLVIKSRSQSKS